MDAKALRNQAAISILTAIIVEDRIAWYEDHECFGASQSAMIETAVNMAYLLVEELAKRDPILASELQSERQIEEINRAMGISPWAQHPIVVAEGSKTQPEGETND
jgi:hypothetical protein